MWLLRDRSFWLAGSGIAVMVAMTLFAVGASSLSPLLAGFLFDRTGTYRQLLLLFMTLTAAALLFVPLLRNAQIAAAIPADEDGPQQRLA